ncbi:GNAT family N-acetyltransferase (plasmid) [Arthrobacter sp. UC242_113]|uniref:GNAT family N-acetyltransferase n=1 Tax=Arthrobacter sp. UC242_113 TaxID=3374550 RepID=UPI0037570D04
MQLTAHPHGPLGSERTTAGKQENETDYLIRRALPVENETVGRLTWEGLGYPSTRRLAAWKGPTRTLLDTGTRARQGVLLVAEDIVTGRLLGTASVLPFGSPLNEQALEGESELKILAVLPDARRSGLGSLLLREAVRVARSQGANRLVLDTAVDTGPAHLRLLGMTQGHVDLFRVLALVRMVSNRSGYAKTSKR